MKTMTAQEWDSLSLEEAIQKALVDGGEVPGVLTPEQEAIASKALRKDLQKYPESDYFGIPPLKSTRQGS